GFAMVPPPTMTATRTKTPKALALEPFELDALVLLGVLLAPHPPRDWALWMKPCGLRVRSGRAATAMSMTALAKRLVKRGVVHEHLGPREAYSLADEHIATVLLAGHDNGRLSPLSYKVQKVVASPPAARGSMDHRRFYDWRF